MFDQVLKKLGMEWTDLNEGEKDTMRKMRQSIENEEITIDDLREHIEKMIDHCIDELNEIGDASWTKFYITRRRRHLLARLENYRLMKNVLNRKEKMTERAKRDVEQKLRQSRMGGGGMLDSIINPG